MAKKSTRTIEVFKPGTFTPMSGSPITFSADDLKTIAEGYDHVTAPAPLVVGHPKTDAPAYGWVSSFAYDAVNERLVASVDDLDPAFSDAVTAKRYRKISMSFFRPDAANNPKPGRWYPKHIGFLGATAPAVPGLKPVELAGDEDGVATIEFGEPAFRDVASLFRGLREFLVEKFDADTADRVLPTWSISWIDQNASDDDDGPRYAEPRKKEKPMPTAQEAAFAAREAELAAKEERLAARERQLRHEEHADFAEGLADEGRLLPALAPKVTAVLDALAEGDATEVSFAEGGETKKASLLDAVRDILGGNPKIVSFGEHKMPSESAGGSADFASPPGVDVDRDGLATLAKARAYQAAHPNVSFKDAVKAVEGK